CHIHRGLMKLDKAYILSPNQDGTWFRMTDAPQRKLKASRMPLSALQTAYEGPGRLPQMPRDENGMWSMDATRSLIKGIRITATQEPGEVLSYLNDLKKRFVLRGRILRQIKVIRRDVPRLGRSVVYASRPDATHRVLVFAYYGNLEDIDAEDPKRFVMEPLARVDVRPPFSYISGRFKDLAKHRLAVERYAER